MMSKVKVSDLLAQTLEELGIRHIFGMIGAGNVHLFESISRRGYTEIVCIHHEQAATMAMQTYYRMHARLAACLLTTGAGASNGVTGVLSAWADSIPGLVIAGNENSKFTKIDNPLRMWGVQGYDSVDMVKKITKYSSRVTHPEHAMFEVKKAAFISKKNRPGPCWIEVPMDIQANIVDYERCLDFKPPLDILDQSLSVNDLDSVIESLKNAKRPVIWLGHGIRLAKAEHKLNYLLNALNVPALVSWAGIDMVDSDHPLLFGRAGVYGQRCANFVLQNCDYLLTIGSRLAIPQIGYDLTELARDAVIDIVDIDSSEATKHQSRTRKNIVCDASIFIDQLLANVSHNQIPLKNQWLEQCAKYKNEFPWVSTEHDDQQGFMNSYRFMERLNRFFKDNQVVVTDMGTALLSGHQVLKFKSGQRLMTSTGLGEMGFGLPAAIGASFASERGEVMCLNCDGGMMLNLQELQTIVHHELPIKIFIFNNDGYLMIKHTQRALFKAGPVGTNKNSGVSCPDFSKIGKAFGIPTFQIKYWSECDSVLEQVQSIKGPVICEVFMHPEQLFSPKLSLVAKSDGSLVSPPLEDLSPLLSRDVMKESMLIGLHQKSQVITDDKN
jgi:acetolactate synthase I/II/III large subunit